MATYRVLELAGETGAYCSRLLAGMGMDVVKVEPPNGDRSRRLGPYLGNEAEPENSLRFWYLNAGKRGITLDLDSGAGLKVFHNLASTADVLVETFQPGYLDRLGAGYRELSVVNPGLVMVSVTGFGQDGPYRDFQWSDIVAQAMGGQMCICGDRDTPPLALPGNQAYYMASLFAATGVLLALRARRKTGRGQHIDISLQECVAATLDHVLPRYFELGETARRQGSLHWNNAFRVFPCRDGHISLSVLRQWDTLVEWLDSEGMAADLKDARWQDPARRREGIGHIIEALGRWASSHEAVELEEQGQLMGFPWARVASPSEVSSSPQLRSRGFFIPALHEDAVKTYVYPVAPCLLSRSPWVIRRRPPLLGEHNSEILVPGCGNGHTVPSPLPWGERIKVRGNEGDESRTSRWFHPHPSPLPSRERGVSWGAPLANIRVIDFTRVLAGPHATRMLADFGAEVIKVQRPGEEEEDDFGKAYYRMWNRNKLSVALDISQPEGIALARRLISKSDVLVENFSPRVMANWGLDYEDVRRLNPGIIMVSLSAMGQTGPSRDYTGFGPTVHALSGLTYLTGFSPGRPLGPGHAYADHVAGVAAALAALAALEHRDRTGEGQHVDVSAMEAVCALLGVPLMEYLVNGTQAGPQGNRSGDSAPHGCYRCQGEDSWCAIAVETDEQWQGFVQALSEPAWALEPRFATAAQRVSRAAELDPLVEQWTSERSAEEVMRLLQYEGVPAGVVQDAARLASDPQLNFRGFFLDPETGISAGQHGFKMDANPVRLSETPAQYRRPAQAPNEDRGYVFGRLLGMTNEEVRRLQDSKVIA